MRCLLVLLLVTTACKDEAPVAPDPKQFATLSLEQKCETTRPRASRCIDEILIAQLESMAADKEMTDSLAKGLRREKSGPEEADEMHRTSCRASDAYADAVYACWAKTDCKSFAACVMEKDVIRRRVDR